MTTVLNIMEHVIQPDRGDLTKDLARYVLSLTFTSKDQERYALLADRAQEGALTPEESRELDNFLSVNDFLTVMKAKARQSLANGNR
jgi:hypothetical protein